MEVKMAMPPRSQLIVVDVVQQPIGTVGTGPADGQREWAACSYLTAGCGGKEAVGIRLRSGSCSEGGKLHEVAAVQRKLRDLLRGDDLTERGIAGLGCDRVRRDLDGGRDIRGDKREVQLESLIHLKGEVFGFGGLEARGFTRTVYAPTGSNGMT